MIEVRIQVSSERMLGRIGDVLRAESLKVASEMVKAREDLEAADRYDSITGTKKSREMVDRLVELVDDLTSETTELMTLGLRFARKEWLRTMLNEMGEGAL
jgi:hypothetical protein